MGRRLRLHSPVASGGSHQPVLLFGLSGGRRWRTTCRMEHGLADGHYGKGAIRFDSIYGAFLTIEQGYEICITVFVRPTLLLLRPRM